MIDEKIEQSDALCDKADDVFEEAAKLLSLLQITDGNKSTR